MDDGYTVRASSASGLSEDVQIDHVLRVAKHSKVVETCYGARLKFARESRGLTQEELAQRAKLSMMPISRPETGRIKRPPAPVVEALARALDTTAGELLGVLDRQQDDPPGWQEYMSAEGDSLPAELKAMARDLGLAALRAGLTPSRMAYAAWVGVARSLAPAATTH